MPVPKRHDQATAEADIPNPSRRTPSGLYGDDLYTWAIEQAAALRAGDLESLDLANLAEEIEDLGSEQLHKLTSAYRIVLTHVLKWDHQPERRSRSWATSINSQRSLRATSWRTARGSRAVAMSRWPGLTGARGSKRAGKQGSERTPFRPNVHTRWTKI